MSKFLTSPKGDPWSGFVWRELTRNCHVAWLPYGVSVSVERHRSWKKLGHNKPWYINGFGKHRLAKQQWADLDEAKLAAQEIAESIIRALAATINPTVARQLERPDVLRAARRERRRESMSPAEKERFDQGARYWKDRASR